MQLQHTAVLVPAGDRELQASPQKVNENKLIIVCKEGTPVANTMYDRISVPSSQRRRHTIIRYLSLTISALQALY